MKAFLLMLNEMDLEELRDYRNLIELDIVAAMQKANSEKDLFEYRNKIRLVDTEIFNRTNPEIFKDEKQR